MELEHTQLLILRILLRPFLLIIVVTVVVVVSPHVEIEHHFPLLY